MFNHQDDQNYWKNIFVSAGAVVVIVLVAQFGLSVLNVLFSKSGKLVEYSSVRTDYEYSPQENHPDYASGKEQSKISFQFGAPEIKAKVNHNREVAYVPVPVYVKDQSKVEEQRLSIGFSGYSYFESGKDRDGKPYEVMNKLRIPAPVRTLVDHFAVDVDGWGPIVYVKTDF